MKKFGKVILSVVLIGAIGFAGFMLGSNVDLGQGGTTRDKELISEMDSLKGLLDKNFLLIIRMKTFIMAPLRVCLPTLAILILPIIQRKSLANLWRIWMAGIRE